MAVVWRLARRAAALSGLLAAGALWAGLGAAQERAGGLAGGRAAVREGAERQKFSAIAARLERSGENVRLVIETSAPPPVSAYPVAGPDRIIVDLPEVAFLIDPAAGRPAASARALGPLIKSYRFGLFAPGRSRIVIDLAGPAKILRAASLDKDGARIEIELAPTDAASFAAAAAARPAVQEVAAAPPPSAAPASGKPVVVIDPGHGGVDMGATGKHGEQEKQIVFDFARALTAKIEARGRIHAVLTRSEDVFVPLDERVRFARRNNASLFLSIHADTLGEGHVEGATVYTVSAKASDAEAAKIAEKENFADQAAGLERREEADEVGDILFDLTRRETRAYSREFAQALVSMWKDAGSLNKNPSRSAGFVVLKAYDVPSVLLELGYLSSEKDLAKLTSPQWRGRAAEITAQAIESYFAEREKTAALPVGGAPARADASGTRPQ